MKRLYLLLLCCGLLESTAAQVSPPAGAAAAEYAFSGYALQHGMKAAFLQYTDSGSVIFHEGRVLGARQYWQQAPAPAGKLLWQPVFACTAADGNSGFTTGPFEFRKSLQDSVLGCGQYSTIWLKNASGEWHFLADLGITYPTSLFNLRPLQQYNEHLPSADTSATAVENAFLEQFRHGPQAALQAVLLPASWLNINGQHPFQGPASILAALRQMPPDITFTPLAGVMAQSRDLAYIYGYTLHGGKQESYLRVWAHTAGGWKLLLQVLKW
ncbi:hypothetical protein [Chitinophaga sp.]|uniref:hypothetical protein n=1 Tax=Chitinophaga sp. TaxID=1869181 RepID=UPI0031E47CFB